MMKTITTFSQTKSLGKKFSLAILAILWLSFSAYASKTGNNLVPDPDTGSITIDKNHFEDYFLVGGNAKYYKETGTVSLTTDEQSQVGNFTLGTQIDVNHSFTLKGRIFLGYKNDPQIHSSKKYGADGIGFAFHRSPAGHVGEPGGAIGIGGLEDAVGIKFDTHMNREDFNGKEEPFLRDPIEYQDNMPDGWDYDERQYHSRPFMAFAHTVLGKNLGGNIPENLKKVPIVITDKPGASSRALPSMKLDDKMTGWWGIVLTYDGVEKEMKCELSYKDELGKTQTMSIKKNIRNYLKMENGAYLPYSFSVSASTGARVNNHSFKLESFTYTPSSVAYSRNFELIRGVDGYDLKPISDFFEYRGKLGAVIPTNKQLAKMKADGYVYKKFGRVIDLVNMDAQVIQFPEDITETQPQANSYEEYPNGQGYFTLGNQVQGVYYIFEKADLKIEKSVDKEQAVQGEILEYTITVTNVKDVAINNVEIYDAVDKQLEFISSDNNGLKNLGNHNDGRLVLGANIESITPNEKISLKFKAKIKNDAPSGGVIINQALAAFEENGEAKTKYSNPVYTDIGHKVTIEGTKNLIGREMIEGEFEFEVLTGDGASHDPRIIAKNKKDGTFELTLSGYPESPALYHYKIREINNNLPDIIYDKKEYGLMVRIAADPSGATTIKATITDGKEVVQKPVFNNAYIPTITKEVNNATPKPGDEISYTIKTVLPSDINTNYEIYQIIDKLPADLSYVSATTNQKENWEIRNNKNTVYIYIPTEKFASMPTHPLEITITAKVDNKTELVGQTINNTAGVYSRDRYNKETKRNSNTVSITPTVSTGVNLVKSKSKVKIYPNPVTDNLHIVSESKIKRIELFDMLGKLILTKESANETELLDLSSLKAGVYYLRVIEETSFSTLKLIKK